LELARDGIIEGVTCEALLDELANELHVKLKFPDKEVNDIILELLTFLRLVNIKSDLEILTTDPDDNKILECAIVAKATHIITGDRRHLLPLKNFKNISIVSARDFLDSVMKIYGY
jgi:putative PIN family toxin of toxin-antitoxin system